MNIAEISDLVRAAGHQVALPRKFEFADAQGSVSLDLVWTASIQTVGLLPSLILCAYPIDSQGDVVVDARAALQEFPATYWFISDDHETATTVRISDKPSRNQLRWLGASTEHIVSIQQQRVLTLVLNVGLLRDYMDVQGTSFRPRGETKAVPMSPSSITALRAAGEPQQISS